MHGSPFKVQTRVEPWPTRRPDRPRRAAVSAFGFGGINAHILFEAWPMTSAPASAARLQVALTQPDPVAIVGMEVRVGALNGLEAFRSAILEPRSAIVDRPRQRWKGADAAFIDALDGFDPKGAYIDRLSVGIGEFQLPPNEIDAILPQQLLALKVGAGALVDAGMPLHDPRERMGVIVGIGFDFEATNFHLRWQLFGAVERWNQVHGLGLDDPALSRWLERLRDQCGPPLTSPRVLGALGGVVASRMAREFRFGGPSFVVSADAASGIKALGVAVDLLQQGAADAMLVGAVDLAGEGRSVVRTDRLTPLSRSQAIRPFDAAADGTLPGDGAVALVLKPLARARADGDRIYAVLRGIASAGGDDPTSGRLDDSTYRRSIRACFDRAGIAPGAVSLVNAHGSGVPDQDRVEITALSSFFNAKDQTDPSMAIALGSTKPITGHTGAADGLISLAQTALCLYHRVLPPLAGYARPAEPWTGLERFHMPAEAQPWYRDRMAGLRCACIASISTDGTCSHVLLQEHEPEADQFEDSRSRRCMGNRGALFVVEADTLPQLHERLSELEAMRARLSTDAPIESSAARWLEMHPLQPRHRLALALILTSDDDVESIFAQARQALASGGADALSRQVFFRGDPQGAKARIAMVYPGSGNHYVGMGRRLALHFPRIVDRMDRDTQQLKTQMRPWNLMPWRHTWPTGWESDAASGLTADPLNMIFGQVVFGDLTTRILDRFSIRADALIGYSLGESTGLFAQGVWSDRGRMLARMQDTDLFTLQLAGPCRSLRRAWQIPEREPIQWRVAVVNRPAGQVRQTLAGIPHVRLLIVNSPNECVIGGLEPAVERAVAALACQAVGLDGVVTVHCDAARPVADAYRRLHLFPINARSDLSVYSCGWAKPYLASSTLVADSILKQAVEGFDFTQTINRAYADGIRIFIEAGPRASCSRMIDQILFDRPHLCVAVNHAGQDEMEALLRCLARLCAERVSVDLVPFYADRNAAASTAPARRQALTRVTVGGPVINPTLPEMRSAIPPELQPEIQIDPKPSDPLPIAAETPPSALEAWPARQAAREAPESPGGSAIDRIWTPLLEAARQNTETAAAVHRQFLDLSTDLTRTFADTFNLQIDLLARGARPKGSASKQSLVPASAADPQPERLAFDRSMCMEFAIGSAGRVLGPAFDIVDSYRVRVRLPDEPLMLVDRILSVDGAMLSLGPGRVTTEHDVLPGAWYLDGDRAPVCISVEAGQADLFLSAYLGIDHQVKGERAYRLLDAVVVFHRGLPRPGETIRYDITIDRFVRQGDTWMFFFRYDGYIGSQLLISMRDGCAGFFTQAEVDHSGGIILTESERRPLAGTCPDHWQPPVPLIRESYTDDQLDALRRGDLVGCFGQPFASVELAESLALPDGRMRLIHRILDLDPAGGRYGLGLIRAEADIHPDDWFLTCHFVDDRVMPATMMYECCAHTLRVFLQRMGWVSDRPEVCYEPVVGSSVRLKCRGPVTPTTRRVHYEIQISEIGYGPEPFAVADAHMFADGRPIVLFKNMSMKMTGLGRQEIDALWRRARAPARRLGRGSGRKAAAPLPAIFDRESILAFAVGNPSEAFGAPYRIFDQERRIARLPGPPYLFMDRVTGVEPAAWVLEDGGWVTAQYDMVPDGWYFTADRSGVLPFCVLLEIALQPCGWLAAFAGSALRSRRDLKFRNLGGSAVLHRQVRRTTGTLTMRCRIAKVSEAADMIIEHFDFEVLAGDLPIYTGDTYFGFFSAEALAEQKGLSRGDPMVQAMDPWSERSDGAFPLPVDPPYTPAPSADLPARIEALQLPGKALLMIDEIEAVVLDAGRDGEGYIRGVKRIDPDEWFFKAHFHQDPVCPGSLGMESFLQLMKIVAMKRWPQLTRSHRFRLVEGVRHTWSYRGQIVPDNRKAVVEARITHLAEGSSPSIRAEGLLKVDGLPIYKMENFELALVPARDDAQP
ncbi:MAG: beta-ketoacyl synthase N-terminal-like domain-containing protein [Desulfosarcina sp.]